MRLTAVENETVREHQVDRRRRQVTGRGEMQHDTDDSLFVSPYLSVSVRYEVEVARRDELAVTISETAADAYTCCSAAWSLKRERDPSVSSCCLRV